MAPDPRRDPRPEDPADRPPEADGPGPDSEEWQPRPNDFLVEPMFAPFEGPFEGAGSGDGERPGGDQPEGERPIRERPGVGDPTTGPAADGRPRALWARLRAFFGLE